MAREKLIFETRFDYPFLSKKYKIKLKFPFFR